MTKFLAGLNRQITAKPCHDLFKLSHRPEIVEIVHLDDSAVISRVEEAAKYFTIRFCNTGEFMFEKIVFPFGVMNSKVRVSLNLLFSITDFSFRVVNEHTNGECCHKRTIPLCTSNAREHHRTQKYLIKDYEVIYSTPESTLVFFQVFVVVEVKNNLMVFHCVFLISCSLAGALAVVAYCPYWLSLWQTCISPMSLVAQLSYSVFGSTSTLEPSTPDLVYQNQAPILGGRIDD